MESRPSADPRSRINLKTERIVNRRNRTDYATPRRPGSGVVTILLILTHVTIVLTEIYNLKEVSDLFIGLEEEFNGDMESYKRDISKCAEQTEAPIDDISNLLRNKPQDTKQGRCFVACIMKKNGIMKNSEIDVESYMNAKRKVYGEDVDIMDHLKRAMGECLTFNKGLDECAYASFFNECMYLSTKHVLKRVHREKQETKQVPKERAKKVIKDEL